MNIYYLGPDGSYSHSLVKKIFTSSEKHIPCNSFHDVVAAVQSDNTGIGVLAIENSISSSVHQTVDLLYNSNVCIVGEASMNVCMNLIGSANSAEELITDIYSHPQAIAQCSYYIQKQGCVSHEMLSTSEAVQYILSANNPAIAAIGNVELVDNRLKILKEDIANVHNNMTRWVFIAQEGTQPLSQKINKLTYIFKVKHESGSLLKVLSAIAKLKGNLTKIESRPLPGTHWEYGFWVDIEIDEKLRDKFDVMMKETSLQCRCVGAYEKGELFS
ncbi:hypothetical protein BH09PAT2_BH09PAT2_00720 [soil metagenome]